MKTVTVEQLIEFEPCWLWEKVIDERLWKIGSWMKEWTAMDVLALEEVSADDRLRAVLREDFLDKNIIVEFACLCAERALAIAGVTDKRCWNAVNVRRSWIRGEASDNELASVLDVEWYAERPTEFDEAQDAAWYAARDAAQCDSRDTALAAALEEVRTAEWYAVRDVEWDAINVEQNKVYNAERAWQIETLKRLIVENEKEEQR